MQRSQHTAGGDFEDGSIIPAAVTAIIGRAVKVSVGALDERRLRRGAVGQVKTVQRSQCTSRRYSEDRSQEMRSAGLDRAVEVPVRGLHQSRVRVRALLNGEAVQRSQCSLLGNLEDCSFIVCAA